MEAEKLIGTGQDDKEEGSSAANMTRQTGRGQEGGGLDRKKKKKI